MKINFVLGVVTGALISMGLNMLNVPINTWLITAGVIGATTLIVGSLGKR